MKILKSLAIAIVTVGLLTACSSEDLTPSNASIDQVIDVRTAAEYSQGHIAGAINIEIGRAHV